MLNRRDFIIKSGLAGTGAMISMNSFGLFAPKRAKKLVILHTNDMHSRIEPFPIDHPKHPGLGGMARRAALINKIREEEENVLLLDSGDIFQGTPYFNQYGGELEFKLMSKMGYDAATMGNHDFDNGLDGFDKMLPFADFPFVCSNYDFSNTQLSGKTKENLVLNKGGVKIGILGLGVELNGLVDKRNFEDTQYLDPIEKANHHAKLLKEDKSCDLVICLSHLGYEYESSKISDVSLAPKTDHIDLILGGHTHTLLEKPVELRNKSEKKVYINQVGWAGIALGRIDIDFVANESPVLTSHHTIELKKNYAKT